MENPTSVTIQGISQSVVTVGNQNLIEASLKFEKMQEPQINSDRQNWKSIIKELEKLQAEIKNISDEHEVIRDTELVPAVSKAKVEAKQIAENPTIEKKSFIEKMKGLCDVSGKIIDVGTKLSPFILAIGKLAGLSL